MPFPCRIPGAGEERLVTKWRESRGEEPDPARLSTHRHLMQAGDYLLGGDFLVRLRVTVAQIIRAQHHDNVCHAGLGERVAIEALEAAVSADVVQNAVPAESLVDYR